MILALETMTTGFLMEEKEYYTQTQWDKVGLCGIYVEDHLLLEYLQPSGNAMKVSCLQVLMGSNLFFSIQCHTNLTKCIQLLCYAASCLQ